MLKFKKVGKQKVKLKLKLLLITGLVILGQATAVMAADNSTFNQLISNGALSTDILDASQTPVSNPSITLSSKNYSFSCYDGSDPSTGTFGEDSQRIYVVNPDASTTGWVLSLAATDGATGEWENSGVTETYDFNDPTGSACTDGADADSDGGQMTLDPSLGTIHLDCSGTCSATGVTKGSQDSYEEGVTDSLTLMSADSSSDSNWRGYLTGVGVEQTIPAQQAADSYSINMTLSVVAS